ncbi:hypothetical protein HDU91_003442 [Kappamyces sp. JEL0680]|nr:hypothetical protein HDU91_003442 [Kappamyces sp. JEL0680]
MLEFKSLYLESNQEVAALKEEVLERRLLLNKLLSCWAMVSLLQGDLSRTKQELATYQAKWEDASVELRSVHKKLHRLQVMKSTAPPVEKEATSAKSEKANNPLETVVQNEQYLELVGVAEARAVQVDLLAREKYTLQRDLDNALLRLSEARAGKEVEKELRYQLGLQDSLKHQLEKMHRENESLQATRRSYVEQIMVCHVV